MLKNEQLDELLNSLKNNDQEALAQIYDMMHNEIFRYIYSIVKNKEYAQDLTQDTFIHLYKNAALYNNKGHAKAWIITISRNITYMFLRKNNRELVVDYDIEETDDSMGNINNKLLIEKMMSLLDTIEREIIVLHVIDGLTFREVSEVMNIALPTTLSKYHRSLKKLRKSMEV